MQDLTEVINSGELNRNNLPIEKKPRAKELEGYVSIRPIAESKFEQVSERLDDRSLDFYSGEDREHKIASNQSTAELWGKGIWNTAVEATVGTLEGAAMLPGIDWTLKQVGESETGFGNFLSDAMGSVKESMKTDIYQTQDSREGFAPWDGTWWASNSETLGTTLSLMIPAMGMAAAAGKLGKLAKLSAMRNSTRLAGTIANNAALVKNVENASKILGQATISRWTENTMEAQGTFEDTYQELISNGASEEVARSKAGIAASRAWNANWVNLAQDAVQFATIGKVINSATARSAKTLAENAKGLGKKTLGLAGTMASESLEEAGQYVIGQEAKQSVTDQNYRFSDLYSRIIDDYSKDPELHTSMFFGALGGGVFQGAGNIIESRLQKRIQKDIEDNKQKVNAILNDDYVKEAGIDTSLIFNKTMAYADMGVIDDLKDSVNKELIKTDEEHANEGRATPEAVEEYKTKLKDVLADMDFISDVRMRADNGYKDPMAVRLQVASEYSLKNFGKKLNTVKTEYGKLSADSLASDGTVEALTRLKDIDTLGALKAFREQVGIQKEDGTYPVRNLEDVQSYIDQRIKNVEAEITSRLPENTTLENYLKKDKSTTVANEDAFRKNIAAHEELQIAMEDFRSELEIAKGNKIDILRERARKATLNTIKEQIREDKVSLSDIRDKISTIKDPDFKVFIEETTRQQGTSAIPLGKDRNNDIIKRYTGKTLLFAKEMDEIADSGIDNISVDNVESFIAKYNSDTRFKAEVDSFYDAKAKQEGKFYDLTEIRREANDAKPEEVTIDTNPVYEAFATPDKIMNSLEVALVKKINDSTVVFFGFNNSDPMPLSEFEKLYSSTYLYDEFTPLYRLDGSVVANDFNTFVNTKGETVTLISNEAHQILNDPTIDLRGKNTRYRVYTDHPQYSPEGSNKGFLVGIEVEVSEGKWLTMGRMPIGKAQDRLSIIREQILQKYRESGSEVIDLGSKVTVKQNGFIKRKAGSRNSFQTIAKDTDVLAIVIPTKQDEIGLVYGNISEDLAADMRASTNRSKLARYAGNTVLMVKQSDGSYVPTKLRTKKVSEVEGMYEKVESLLEEFEAKAGTHTQEDLDILHSNLHEITFLVIERLSDGSYRQIITTQGGDVWSDPMSFKELKDSVKAHKAMRVDKDRINDKRYHTTYLEKYGILTTDIVPDNRLVGASIAIDLHSDVQVTPEKKADNKKKATKPVEQKENVNFVSMEDLFDPAEIYITDEEISETVVEEPKKETKVEDDKFSDFDDIELHRTKDGIEDTSPMMESEKEWFKKYYPSYEPKVLDDLSTVSSKGGSELYGMFKNGIVYLSSDAATGTLRHEAFHLVFNSMLTDSERKDILTQERYNEKLDKKFTDIDVEESLADKFMDVKLTKGEIINTFTGKIKDFFKRLWNIAQIFFERNNLKGSPTIDQLFYRANRGLYNRFPKFQRNVTRFRKNVYGDLSMAEAKMASQVIANNIANAVTDHLKKIYNMPDAETIDVLKKASKLNDPNYERKSNEEKLKGYSFNDLLYVVYRNFNKTSQDPSLTEAQKNSLIRVMTALGHVVEDKVTKEKKFIAGSLRNLVVGEMQNYGIKADVSNLNETTAKEINEDEDGVPDDQTDESFDFKDRFTSSLKDFRARTRQLFASIPNSSKSFASYDLYHDPSTVYNTIKKQLESSLDQNDMMKRMEALYDLHPDYEVIADKFANDYSLKVEFYKNFAQRNNTSFIKIISGENGTKTVLESNKANITSDIRSDWYENFLNTSNYIDNDTGKISDKGKQTATDNLEIIKRIVADNVNTLFLNEKDATTVAVLLYDAGIIMDTAVIKRVLMTDPPKNNRFGFGKYKMKNLLNGTNKAKGLDHFYSSVAKGINPFQISDTDTSEQGSSIDMNKMMDNITYQVSTMFPEMRSSIFQNGKGKSVDSNLLPRDSARRLLRLKHNAEFDGGSFIENMRRDPFWQDSKFLNELYDNAKEMKLAIMDTNESGSGDHREYSELTAKNFHTSLMNMFFNYNKEGQENQYGWYGMPIPSDSTAYNIIRFKKYSTGVAQNLIVDAVNNERNRIKELEALIAANQEEYNAWIKLDESERKYTRPEAFKDIPFNFLLNGRKYHTFGEDLNDGDKAKVFKDNIEFKNAVLAAYEKYFQRTLQDLIAKDVIAEENGNYSIKDTDLDYRIGGTKVTKGKTTETVPNSTLLYNNINRFIANATLMNIQTAFIFAGDIAYYKHDKKTKTASIEDFFKRVKQINSPGTYLDTTAVFKPMNGDEIKVRKSYRVGVVQDRDTISSDNLDRILKIQEDYVRSLKYTENEVKKHLDDIRYKYSGMNITDAFTVIDLYRYREIAVASAQWNNVKEALYQKIMSGEEVDPKEMEIMQPFKPFRYSIEFINGKYVPVQHKNAEMLITPQMARYNSVHRTAMEKMGYTFTEDGKFTFDEKGRDSNKYIDSLMYNSSVKVGEMRTFPTEDSIVPSETQLFDNDDYRIQMGTPDHFIDSEINIGSQIRKLIMEGFDLTSSKTYSIGGEQMTGRQIIDLYNDIMSKNLEESYQEVRSIFTDNEGNIDRSKMVSELKKYIIERELGTDYLEAVELIDGRPTIPYWYPTIAYNLQAIFSAFYKNNVTKQTASGMALFNSSSVGYMDGTALPKPKIVFNVDGSSIDHIEALIPINSKRLLKYVDPKTGLVDVSQIEKLDPRLLKGLFYRIPSEDKYSMVHIKVVGYLPTSMGAQIILPDEITTMAGLDFDIDKMFGMMYSIDNKGITVPSGMDSKEARNNRMLDLMYGIMQLPETAGRQLSPGNFDNLKKIKNDVLNLTGTDASLYYYSQASKVEVQQRNMMGKELIGTFANHRVNHIFFTLSKFDLMEPVEFDGHSLNSLSNTLSPVDNKNIGQRLATFVAAVVDNAKDPIASMLNLAPFLSDVAALMIRVGHTDALVGRFLSQKVFVKLSQNYSNSSEFGAVAVIKLLKALKEDLVLSDKQIEEASTLSITMDVLKENLKKPDPVVDLALINKMLLMYEQADMLRKIMATMRYDSTSKAAGPTYFETEAKVQEAKNVINNEDYIIGYKNFLTNDSLKWVRDFYSLGVVKAKEDMITIMELPYENDMFQSLIGPEGYFNRWKFRGTLKPSELETLTRAIMTVNASSFEPFSNERSKVLMSTFPDRLQKFKNTHHQYSALTGLITVEQAKPSRSRYSVPFKTLKFNKMGITPSHMQVLRDMWTEMLESDNAEVRTFAQDLAAYSFFTSGFLFKKNSIAEAIPVTWMTQMTSNGKTFIQHITEKNDSSDLNDIQKEEIVRNFYQSLDVFGTVKEKENGIKISLNKDSDLYYGTVDMNANKFYIDTYVNKQRVRTYSPYIRLQLDADMRLLKLVSADVDSNIATYEEIQPLGIHNRYVQFSDGSKEIKGVISIGVSKKKEEVIEKKIVKEESSIIPKNLEDYINSIFPNWINKKENKIKLVAEFATIKMFNFENYEDTLEKRIKEGKFAENILKTEPRNKIEDVISNILYNAISGKLAQDGITESQMNDQLFFKKQQVDNFPIIQEVKETVIPEKITEDILPIIKEDQQYESLSFAIADFLSNQKNNDPMTTSEAVDSFEAYSNNPTEMTKEEFNTLTMDRKLTHWFAYKNCK